MGKVLNIYCDESCHLQNDNSNIMVMGAVWCPQDKVKEISERIREFKLKHKIKPRAEIKWTGVSPSKVDFYSDLIDYFFDDDDLCFRGLIINNKKNLNHNKFHQDHDGWYYKMYFTLIKVILDPQNKYKIYLDIKDTNGADKVRKLHEVLCNSIYDFNKNIISNVQLIRSHESSILQLADLFIGAISHFQRGEGRSVAKNQIIEKIKKRSGKTLSKTTLLRENKCNLFFWSPNSDQ